MYVNGEPGEWRPLRITNRDGRDTHKRVTHKRSRTVANGGTVADNLLTDFNDFFFVLFVLMSYKSDWYQNCISG